MNDVLKKIKTIAFKVVKWFFIVSIASVILFRFVPVFFTPLMAIRFVEQVFDSERDIQFKKDWEPISNISPLLVKAVMTSEDQRFNEHFGLDMEAIQKAAEYNEKHQNKKRGASTISQQTAKNVFLFPSRTWLRKGFEVYFTFLIEIFWSKQRIMEVYLNVIELGNGIYGAEAASQYYFNKPASKLSMQQAASLAAILPLPLKWSPVKPNARVMKRTEWIKRYMPYVEGLEEKNNK
ncbi:MAG: monofunctional biosynthetic peptidoglycan transglycosylase [Bacteroidetes bacterium]|jgi:monofunctional biosynthetic peptidoglycan transglycosylase|nr:monofunctional biosynthetic peptidoglycan transglycosylase [Bacteroidota bacterium]